jgi:hypothetical protein
MRSAFALAKEECIMCRMKTTLLIAGLVALATTAARAGDALEPSAFATSILEAAPAISADGSTFELTATEPAPSAGFAMPPHDGVRFGSVRYQPRRGGWRQPAYGAREEPSHIRGVTQLHAGFLDPEGPSNAGLLLGFRGGQRIDDMFELGLGIDWRTKSGHTTEVLSETTGPGGEKLVVSRELSRYSSHLFPVLAYFQVGAPGSLGLAPYAGVAGTYEALFLSAEDSQTGDSFDATYDGWGWQVWGGASLGLSGSARLIGEVFWNDATLGRDVHDPVAGTFRETVSMNGVGARLGFNWGF